MILILKNIRYKGTRLSSFYTNILFFFVFLLNNRQVTNCFQHKVQIDGPAQASDLQVVLRLRMNEVIPLLSLYFFMALRETTSPFYPFDTVTTHNFCRLDFIWLSLQVFKAISITQRLLCTYYRYKYKITN